jgi:hypothetical protein
VACVIVGVAVRGLCHPCRDSVLDLHDNRLYSAVPRSIGRLTLLQYVKLLPAAIAIVYDTRPPVQATGFELQYL